MLQYAEHLELLGFGVGTKQNYYRNIRLIADRFNCDPATVNDAQVREYFVYVVSVKKWAPKTIRPAIAAAKLFYHEMLGLKLPILYQIKAADRPHRPEILTTQQVQQIFALVELRRFRTPLLLMYASGLRISECVNLRIDDIHGEKNKIFIRCSKGGKDHWTILSTSMYHELRKYWSYHRNPLWLFPSTGMGCRETDAVLLRMGQAQEPMNTACLNHALQQAVQAAGINKPIACHTLRHCFATHLLEHGIPMVQVQEYMGHSCIETTAIYAHLTSIIQVNAIDCIDGLVKNLLKAPAK